MKKIMTAVMAAALALTMSVSAFAAGSTGSISASSSSSSSSSSSASTTTEPTTLSNGQYVSVGTSTMNESDKTYAANAVAWERSQGNNAIVVDVAAGFVGDITVAAPVTTSSAVFAYKLHNGETVTVPVTSVGNGYVVVHSDGNNCPYVIVIAGGASATATAATGTSPKTGVN